MTKRTAIVTTTINANPPSYEAWAAQGDLIVAGDVNTPVETHQRVAAMGGRFLVPGIPFPGRDHVPTRSIQQRNSAIWYALSNEFWEYDYILTIDDDNHPINDLFIEQLSGEIGQKSVNTVSSNSGFLNLGEICVPKFHQRGTPYGVDTRLNSVSSWGEEWIPTVVVAQAMVVGDPDCDAIDRMVNSPMVHAVQNRIVVTPGCYAAFNSQATMWRRDWAPVMAVLPHVGRYDDIFASFIFHRLALEYRVALYAGDPVVRQERNQHNLLRDLEQELFGMHIVYDFCRSLREAHISKDMPLWQAYSELMAAVSHLLPDATNKFAHEWVHGWRDIT